MPKFAEKNSSRERCRVAVKEYNDDINSNQTSIARNGSLGLSGRGKTTLLNHVLNNRDGLKVAVIVNDMSEINIDVQLVAQQTELSRTEEKLIEMSNGCICCTLREDLLIEISKLARQGRFDYLLIESTGISEPMPWQKRLRLVERTDRR